MVNIADPLRDTAVAETFRQKLALQLDAPKFTNFITSVIIFNAIILGMETSQTIMAGFSPLIAFLDTLCLSIFVAELAAKLYVRRQAFFCNAWNIFDFVIVGISLVPGNAGMSVLRALRVLRVLRVISVIPSLRRVVEGFVTALPGMGSVFLLMGTMFYVGAVMATKLFGTAFPEWFGTLGRSGFTLFQIMTLESWSMSIVRPVMEVYPHAWAFFVPFIMVTTFAVMNLLVGLIVSSMQDVHAQESDAATDAYRDDVMAKLSAIESRLDALSK